MKRISLLIIGLYIFTSCFSQINSNELLVYSASYEVSGLMTNIAQVTLKTESINTSKSTYLHFSLEAATYSKWDSYFKVRDLYESYVNPVTLKPSMYKRNVLEGNYTKTEKYLFNPGVKTINSTSKKNNHPEIKSSVNISSSTQDVVTLLYKIRTVDFGKFKPGQLISYIIIFDNKEIPVYIKYLGKETVSAGNLGKRECFKISIGAKTNKLKGTDKNLIWLTNDNRKIPCQIKFSIPVGVGQLSLSSAS